MQNIRLTYIIHIKVASCTHKAILLLYCDKQGWSGHCYVANRGKRNALWCVRTRNFSTVIKIPSACDRNFYQFVVNLPIVFPSSQLLRQFAWLRISQDASHFARRNLLAELVEQ